MTNLKNYASELLKTQEAEKKRTGSPFIGRVENPTGVCDTLWIPTTTSNRSAAVNLNHTINGFDDDDLLWGENGNCSTPYVIVELPNNLFNPESRTINDIDRQLELEFLNKLGTILIQKLNKSYNEPLLAVKADDRLPVIIEAIQQISNEN